MWNLMGKGGSKETLRTVCNIAQMLRIHIYATPFSVVLLLLSLSIWLCICRWGFRYNMKDREILSCLIVYFIIITLLNMLFLGHMQFYFEPPHGIHN